MDHKGSQLFSLLVVALFVCIASVAPATTAAASTKPPAWLSTKGRNIIDGSTKQVYKLRCASWSGAQEKWYVPSGLWAQHRSSIAQKAASIGLNCIRMVWSVEGVLGPNSGKYVARVPPQALAANPDLVCKSPLEVMDAVIQAIADAGMVVILDNHSSDAIWCCGVEDENGLWYNARWSEGQWLQSWSIMAKRYANNSAVVGAGLRNEPRPVLTGKILFPSWGNGNAATDLAIAYEKAAAVVLAERPTYLIFAQGLMAGRDLRAVADRPLVLRRKWPDGPVVTNQLAYEVHEYPFLWGAFNFTDFKKYAAELDEAWGYLSVSNTAPIWVGEFGVEHTAKGLNSDWFQAISRYIRERDLGWAYWPLDGQQGPSRTQGAVETYGLLNTTWDGWTFQPLIDHLRKL